MVKNRYSHSIDLKKITIKNTSKEIFAQQLIDLPYRGYEVEELSDGRKIVITKPGGKMTFGRISKEDFLVFIYNPKTEELWQISHNQIYEDLQNKASEDIPLTKKLIDVFEEVLNGMDPDDIIDTIKQFRFSTGESPEALLKAYKWIWGQEDVNYPTGKGRMMSWESIASLRDSL
ncbi:MAG: hypothetical protein J5705_04770 [Bacteroidaceae bacterium]|nr:hypothetical protein [Bacteroidaceae bacterium]